MPKCSHCHYERKRYQRIKGSACPRCGWKPVSLGYKLKKAWRAFQEKEYQPRNKNAKILLDVIKSEPVADEIMPGTSISAWGYEANTNQEDAT